MSNKRSNIREKRIKVKEDKSHTATQFLCSVFTGKVSLYMFGGLWFKNWCLSINIKWGALYLTGGVSVYMMRLHKKN